MTDVIVWHCSIYMKKLAKLSLPVLAASAAMYSVGCKRPAEEAVTKPENMVDYAVVAPSHLDRDGDSISDSVDMFPDDAGKWLGDAISAEDVADTQANRQLLQELREKFVSSQTGLGHYSVAEGTLGFEIYQKNQKEVQKYLAQAQKRFDSYGIESAEDGSLKSSKYPKEDAKFGPLIEDFYLIALAASYAPEDEVAVARVQDFVKWFVASEFTSDFIDGWYLSTVGRSLMMASQFITDEERKELIEFLWESQGKNGHLNSKGSVKFMATQGSSLEFVGLNSADTLRAMIGSLVGGVLMLPEETRQQREMKLYYVRSMRKTIATAASATPGIQGVYKPDYSINHHYYHYVSAYGPQAAMAMTATVQLFQGTALQFSEDELKYVKGYVDNAFFISHYDHVPLGLTGRMFTNNMMQQCMPVISLAALTGGNPDPQIMQIYANLHHGDVQHPAPYRPTYRLNQSGFPQYAYAQAMAKQYVAKHQVQPEFQEGVRMYAYSPSGHIRRGNWSAHVKGMNKWWWSYEGGLTASNPITLFDCYKSHGALEVRYLDPEDPTAGTTVNPELRDGMDMAHRAGATTQARTHEQMVQDAIVSRTRLNATATGGVSLNGQHGLFMFDFKKAPKQMGDQHLKAKKSYFMLGDKVVMLGSGISNKSEQGYAVHTTLFQNFLNQEDRSRSPIFVNSAEPVIADAYKKFGKSPKNIYLLDADGTGYYLAAGQSVEVHRQNQRVLTHTKVKKERDMNLRVKQALSGEYTEAHRAIAWIDHGVDPQDDGYEYVVMPNASIESLEAFSQSQSQSGEYVVHRKDAAAHIVEDPKLGLFAYALFEDYNGGAAGALHSVDVEKALPHESGEEVTANPGYAVVLDESNEGALGFALSYLDLRLFEPYRWGYGAPGGTWNTDSASAPVEVKVVLKGAWKTQGASEHLVSSKLSDGKTELTIHCQDGLSRCFKLVAAE